jgi:vancomycin resistance protein YoaR
LGEVTQAEGYDESYVIVGESARFRASAAAFCQWRTAFRAAFFAGYPIIERWPHAYRVGYY